MLKQLLKLFLILTTLGLGSSGEMGRGDETHIEHPEAIRVLMWNVGREHTREDGPVINQTLPLLLKQRKPDILLLVEYKSREHKPGHYNEPLKKAGMSPPQIINYHPEKKLAGMNFLISYNPQRLELLDQRKEPLASFDPDQDLISQKEYDAIWEPKVKRYPLTPHRIFLDLEFLVDGSKKLHLFPVHFSNAWTPLMEDYLKEARRGARQAAHKNLLTRLVLWKSTQEKIADTSAKASILKDILQGNPNPHQAQWTHFLDLVEETYPLEDEDNLLVLGDFNAFPSIIDETHQAAAFQIFDTDTAMVFQKFHENGFHFPFTDFNKASFPSQLMKLRENPTEVLIDMALKRGKDLKGLRQKVLNVEGSDHYPIEIEFHLKETQD